MSLVLLPLRVKLLISDRVLKNAVEGLFKDLCIDAELLFLQSDTIVPALVLVQSAEAPLKNYHPDSTVVVIANRRTERSCILKEADGWLYEDQLSPQTLIPWIKVQMMRESARVQKPTEIFNYEEERSEAKSNSPTPHSPSRSL